MIPQYLRISENFSTNPTAFMPVLGIISSNLPNRKEMLMTKIQRLRDPEQLQLFEPPKRLPAWRDLPTKIRRRVTDVLARMFDEHFRGAQHNSKGGRDV